MDDDHVVAGGPWTGTWDADDPHANLKQEVAEYTRADPVATLRNLSSETGIAVPDLVRYVLVRWTAEGSEALLSLGPRLVRRLWAVVDAAEAAGTDEARLAAYHQLRQMLSWLRVPLEEGSHEEQREAKEQQDDR